MTSDRNCTPTRTGLIGRWALWTGLLLLAGHHAVQSAAADFQLVVDPVPVPRSDCPTFIRIPDTVPEDSALQLVDPDSGRSLPVQRVEGTPGTACFILPNLPADTPGDFLLRVEPSPDQPEEHGVRVQNRDGQILVSIGDSEVLRYNAARVPAPPGVPDYFSRSGYIHPLRAPSGAELTGDFPADHLHQRALFFAWVKTNFQGRNIDFWNQAAQEGQVEHREILLMRSGPVFGEFAVRRVHLDVTVSTPQPVLEEVWHVRIYNVRKPAYVIDFRSTQSCASENTVAILQYHYGGFALRGRSDWLDNPEHDFLTSLGQGRAEGNHTRPRWVDVFGPVAGRQAGVTILGHPENFRFPQPVRLHPSKPYFCFSPQVLGGFEIEPGEPYTSCYRLLAHDGTPSAAQLDDQWHLYAATTQGDATQAGDERPEQR